MTHDLSEVRDLRMRVNVLSRKRQEVQLTHVEDVELENLGRLIREHEAGYAPLGVAA